MLRWARNRRGIDPRKVVVFGTSNGGASAIYAAAGDDELPALVLDAAFGDLWEAAGEMLRFRGGHPVLRYPLSLAVRLRAGVDIRSVRPFDVITQVKAKVLFVHGDADRQVPVTHSEKMHEDRLRAGLPSEIWILPGGEHGFDNYPPEGIFWNRILDFLDRAIGGPPAAWDLGNLKDFLTSEGRLKFRIQWNTNKLLQRYAQHEARMEAADELQAFATSDAIYGLARRFSAISENLGIDQEEKKHVQDVLIGFGVKAVEPLKRYVRNHDQVTWAVDALKELMPKERLIPFLLEILRGGDPVYIRGEKGNQILKALEHLDHPHVVPGVIPCLQSSDDTVRFVAVECLADLRRRAGARAASRGSGQPGRGLGPGKNPNQRGAFEARLGREGIPEESRGGPAPAVSGELQGARRPLTIS
jgi:hypothetical protein